MSYHLGRIHSTFDPRDYNLLDFIPLGAKLKEKAEMKWEFPTESLNQGDTNHCVGFSIADFGINYPVYTPYKNEDGHNFYYQCKILDGEPSSEEGSTIRSAAEFLKKSNRIDAYAFAMNMTVIKWWLLNRGPLIVGTIWTSEMFSPNNGILSIGGDIVGGHAYLLNEWRADNYIGLQNSWGSEWGLGGKAYIAAENFEKLFNYDGEAMAAVELEAKVAPAKECPLAEIIKNLFAKPIH